MQAQRFPAGTALVIGLLLTTLAFFVWTVETTVMDASRVAHSARAVLEQPTVSEIMARRVTDAVAERAPGTDPNAVSRAGVAAVQQPEFIEAFGAALAEVDDHVLRNHTGDIQLDTLKVNAAVRAGLARTDPALAGLISPDVQIVVTVPTSDLPDLSGWATMLRSLGRLAGLLGVALLGLGFAMNQHKPAALGRIGRWLVVVGFATFLVYWALPRVLDAAGGWAGVAGAVLATGELVVAPAVVMIAIGITAIVGANQWAGADRRRALSVIPTTPKRRIAAGGNAPWESGV